MPFLEYYGDEAEGRWFTIGHDPDTKQEVKIKVRGVPANEAERIERRYRRKIKSVPAGMRLQSLTQVPDAKKWDLLFDNGCYAWMDCEGFTIGLRDDAAVRLFKQEVGGSPKIGDSVCVDGKLTDKIKREIFNKKTIVLTKVIECADLLEKEHMSEEAEETENLPTGSSSSSTTRSPSPSAENVDS